ncbi:MAG: LysR family transcriptional regulator [Phycisphaerales bacterium]|nr:LysR family transcriptional regulator [Phycisphaerales bacterium]
MELHQLAYFVAAAETGSITRAAERCGVAQPSLSQQVQRLERSVGGRLFDRLGRGVALTDAGRALLPRARAILAEVRDARAHLHEDVEAGEGEFRVGAIPTMAPFLLPRAVAALRTEFPRAAITVREDLTDRLVQAVADGELDCAVASSPIDHERVEVRTVGEEPMVVVVPAGHPLAGADDVALAALRDLPTVTLHEMHCLGRQIAGFCAAKRLGRSVVCRTTQIGTALGLVSLGMGVSIVPRMAARADGAPRAGRVYLEFRGPAPRREVTVLTRAGRAPSRVGLRFAERIREALEEG